MMEFHDKYMKRCFELARIAQFKTQTNPCVGSVLVHEDLVIGEGYHVYFGGAHAERNAINSVSQQHKSLIANSTLYISLEPCCIHGKTPPCSDLILESGIKKVVISTLDPNPLMSGNSIETLKEKGVKVISGILEEEGRNLIKPFMAHLEERPYVILKFAQSSDAYFGKRNKQVWFSNRYTQVKVHKWRAEVDALLVGYETARVDNPKLTTRLYPGKNPIRFVLDRDATLPRELKIWTDDIPSYFITENEEIVSDNPIKKFICIAFDDHFIDNLLSTAFKMNVFSIMIEGGANTIQLFIDQSMWDEARILNSDIILESGIRSPKVRGRIFNKEKVDSDHINYVYRV